MTSDPNEIARALTAGAASTTPGPFRYDVQADRWWWSDEVYRMHGFEPGEVVPTTAMILAHKHPEDRARYASALTASSVEGGSFASVHRIVDARGETRVLATIADAQLDGSGRVTAISGYFVDITASVRGLAASEATRQIRKLPPPKRDVHILALTAHAMAGAREEYLAAGMDDYLSKPIEPAVLAGKLAAFIEKRRQPIAKTA